MASGQTPRRRDPNRPGESDTGAPADAQVAAESKIGAAGGEPNTDAAVAAASAAAAAAVAAVSAAIAATAATNATRATRRAAAKAVADPSTSVTASAEIVPVVVPDAVPAPAVVSSTGVTAAGATTAGVTTAARMMPGTSGTSAGGT